MLLLKHTAIIYRLPSAELRENGSKSLSGEISSNLIGFKAAHCYLLPEITRHHPVITTKVC